MFTQQGRISTSCIWPAQKSFYETNGLVSWDVVPEYMSSNAFIAKQYAAIIISYLQDLLRKSLLHLEEPIYILELGAGTGKLAFLLFQCLYSQLSEIHPLHKCKITYVITDFTESVTNIWDMGGYFNTWIESNRVDFAILDAEKWKYENGIHLLKSDITLSSSGKNPLICVANYFFDSLKHDGYSVSSKTGDLEEWILKISSQYKPTEKEFLHSVIGTSEMTWELNFIQPMNQDRNPEDGPYVFDKTLNQILNWYQNQLSNDTHSEQGASFVLPIGAISLLEELKNFSGNNLFMISGDKADSSLEEFDSYNEPPQIVSHDGCFSFTTNFDAIGKFFNLNSGFYFPLTRESEFCVSAFCMENIDNNQKYLELPFYERVFKLAKKLRNSYSILSANALSMVHFGPEHYFKLFKGTQFISTHYQAIQKNRKKKKVAQLRQDLENEDQLHSLIAQLSLSNYDVDFFYIIYQRILETINLTPEEDGTSVLLKKVLYRVWRNEYFNPVTSSDIAFAIAEVFKAVHLLENAKKFFEISANRFPDDLFVTLYNIAICCIELKQYDEALEYLRRCDDLQAGDEDVFNKMKEIEKLTLAKKPSVKRTQLQVQQKSSGPRVKDEHVSGIATLSRGTTQKYS